MNLPLRTAWLYSGSLGTRGLFTGLNSGTQSQPSQSYACRLIPLASTPMLNVASSGSGSKVAVHESAGRNLPAETKLA